MTLPNIKGVLKSSVQADSRTVLGFENRPIFDGVME